MRGGENGAQVCWGVWVWYREDVPLDEVLTELCEKVDIVPCVGQGTVRL